LGGAVAHVEHGQRRQGDRPARAREKVPHTPRPGRHLWGMVSRVAWADGAPGVRAATGRFLDEELVLAGDHPGAHALGEGDLLDPDALAARSINVRTSAAGSEKRART